MGGAKAMRGPTRRFGLNGYEFEFYGFLPRGSVHRWACVKAGLGSSSRTPLGAYRAQRRFAKRMKRTP